MQETQIKRVIDAGITSIYLEEPEFWMRGGYSEAFMSEWQKYYNFPGDLNMNLPKILISPIN